MGALLHCWWGYKLRQPLWKTVWRFLKKLGVPPYDPAIPLLGIYPEETKIDKDTRTRMFTAAWFTIAKTWGKSRCPSSDEWIKKLWSMYTVEYDSAIKTNTLESVLMRWMNLEPITEWSESERKTSIYISMYLWNLERWRWWTQGKSRDSDLENRLMDVAWGRKEGLGQMERVAWEHIHYHV